MLKDGAKPVARLADHSRETDIKGLRVFLGDPVIEHGGKFYISRADFEYRLLPRLRPDLCGPPPRQPHVIVIDPGHGGDGPRHGEPEPPHDGEDLHARRLAAASGGCSRPRATR